MRMMMTFPLSLTLGCSLFIQGLWLILLSLTLSSGKSMTNTAGKLLLADVTSNKLTRSHDGSFGLWSYHGTAKESHASKTKFNYNADLLDSEGLHHVSIASTVYPFLGLTSDQDPVYQEYLMMQSKVAGIDGFLVEWGFMNHSSNEALLSYMNLAGKYGPFKVAVNWCDHWLASELVNRTSEEVIEIFHSNLQYLMDTVYSSMDTAVLYKNHPVIFLFGGGLHSSQLRGVQARPLTLPPGLEAPVWLGSYLNYASTPELWAEWGELLNGTFGWAPLVKRRTPSNMTQWDYYGNTDDAVQYQVNVSMFGRQCVSDGECALWCGSVSPGFDNRGCAGWGQELRYIPSHDLNNPARSTYDAQWEFHTQQSSAEYIIIPTLNDFPEATPILPLMNSSFESLYSTAKYAGLWKGRTIDSGGVVLPSQWYQLYKEMQFYNQTPGLDVEAVRTTLDAARSAIGQGSFNQARDLLSHARLMPPIQPPYTATAYSEWNPVKY